MQGVGEGRQGDAVACELGFPWFGLRGAGDLMDASHVIDFGVMQCPFLGEIGAGGEVGGLVVSINDG